MLSLSSFFFKLLLEHEDLHTNKNKKPKAIAIALA